MKLRCLSCCRVVLLLFVAAASFGCRRAAEPKTVTVGTTSEVPPIRCAVIGGMVEAGFWAELSLRFETKTGQPLEVVASGPKHEISSLMAQGQVDFLTMHACDAVINLVADGHAIDPQPWVKNDFLIVGPKSDPAKIRGETDAVRAVQKIVQSRSKLLVHASLGAQELLSDLMAEAHVTFDPETTLVRLEDKQRQMALLAGNEGAYTLVGRIPFLNGKIPNRDLEVMVQGDARLRRPYVAIVANESRFPQSRAAAARQFAHFLREPETQAWIAEFGRGKLDERPLFFPIDEASRVPVK
jgi:tungstate transport system substrate-binding protein